MKFISLVLISGLLSAAANCAAASNCGQAPASESEIEVALSEGFGIAVDGGLVPQVRRRSSEARAGEAEARRLDNFNALMAARIEQLKGDLSQAAVKNNVESLAAVKSQAESLSDGLALLSRRIPAESSSEPRCGLAPGYIYTDKTKLGQDALDSFGRDAEALKILGDDAQGRINAINRMKTQQRMDALFGVSKSETAGGARPCVSFDGKKSGGPCSK
jgi:hypothetical protein